jgi:4-amino-4-deoxy-L-arabinose transferase-like glycosyltransferase
MRKSIVAAVLLLAVALRAYNLETLPTWNWDEGVNLNIAANLADGRMQQFALKYTWIPHPPLYFMALIPLLGILGRGILTLRIYSVACSAATAFIVYAIGNKLGGEKTGILAMLIYGIAPSAVFWNRMGFAHNQLMLLGTLTLYLLLEHRTTGRRTLLYMASIASVLCFITEYAGIAFMAAVFLTANLYHRKELKTVALLLAVPLACYFILMIYLSGDWFISDLSFSFGRVSILLLLIAAVVFTYIIAKPEKLKSLLEWFKLKEGSIGRNVFIFYLPITLLAPLLPPSDQTLLQPINYLWIIGLFGFFILPDEEERNIMWLVHLSYLGILGAYNRSDHMTTPLYPLLSLGTAIFLIRLFNARDRIFKSVWWEKKQPLKNMIAFTLIFYPLAVLGYQDANSFIGGHDISSTPVGEVELLNAFINNVTRPDNLVLTQSYFAQDTISRKTILLHAIAYSGKPIFYYPALPPERFAFNTSLPQVTYAVLPKGTVEVLRLEGYQEAARELEDWPVVYETKVIGQASTPEIYSMEGKLNNINYEESGVAFQVLKNPHAA